MPVFNGEKHLLEAIESILGQTYKDFELFIINDGSTDSTEQIILGIKDERIRYVKNERNIGLSNTLNKGLSLIDHAYIARMDADDIAFPTRFEEQVKFLDTHPGHILCGTQIEYFGDASILSDFPVHDEDIRIQMLFNNCISHPTVMLRAAAFKDNKLFYDPSVPFPLDDYELWIRAKEYGKFHVLPERLLRYRLQGQNYSYHVKHQKRQDGYLLLYRKQLEKLNLSDPLSIKCHFDLSFGAPENIEAPATIKDYTIKLQKAVNSVMPGNPSATLQELVKKKWDKLFFVYADKSFRSVWSYLTLSRSFSPGRLIYLAKRSVRKFL